MWGLQAYVTTVEKCVRRTWSKSGGTLVGVTKLLMTAGAPLRKSRAEPLGASVEMTTTPDLRV